MADQDNDLTYGESLVAQLRDEVNHRRVLDKASSFVMVGDREKQRESATLLLEMGVVPLLVHIVRSLDDLENAQTALVLLNDILKRTKEQLPEVVDVKLVKTLVAKLPDRSFAPEAASVLATIAEATEQLREMVRRHGLMDAILVTARKFKSGDDFDRFTRLLSAVFQCQGYPRAINRSTREEFLWMILVEVHAMFQREEFDDSSESFQAVLPLLRYLLERPAMDPFEGPVVCQVVTDFFRQPTQSKVLQIMALDLAPIVEFVGSENGDLASAAISCVASLAGSGPLLTNQLLPKDVVCKLSGAAGRGFNSEGICSALRELVRHGGPIVITSLHPTVIEWVDGMHSNDRKTRLAACTTLVRMKQAEDAVPGRIKATLGELLFALCQFLKSPQSKLEVELVLTHIGIIVDVLQKHNLPLDYSSDRWQNNFEEILEAYTHDSKLYTSGRARVLLERLRDVRILLP